MAEDAPEMAPRWPKIPPHGVLSLHPFGKPKPVSAKVAPRLLPVDPKQAPRWPEDAPKMAQRCPQDGPKMPPRWHQRGRQRYHSNIKTCLSIKWEWRQGQAAEECGGPPCEPHSSCPSFAWARLRRKLPPCGGGPRQQISLEQWSLPVLPLPSEGVRLRDGSLVFRLADS